MKTYWEQVIETTAQVPRDELRLLLKSSDCRGWQALATTYSIIVLSFLLVALYPSVPGVLVALVLIGGRQLALAILTHEAVHKTLFTSKRTNDWVGTWLCANPMGIDLAQYRAEHFEHHKKTGTAEDPDRGLIAPYPITKSSMVRKCLRDLFGITGVKRVYYILMMGFGFVTYTVSTNARPIDQTGRKISDIVKTGFANLRGPVLANLILFGILYGLGAPILYLLWVGAYLSSFSLFLRIRSIAEHACTPDSTQALLNARSTYASWLARLFVAPHRVNFHLEHHLFMQVPYFNLPPLHDLLERQGILQNGCRARNYLEVLRLATRS